MATTTTRLGLRLPDPTDLVSVTSDINASMSALDAAVGYEVVTALPSAPYKGKTVTVSTDSYRSYFSNGTAPASGSWVEVPNSSGTFGSNLKLASAAQITIGADVNLFRNAANVLRTNDALIVDGAATLTGGVTSGLTLNSGDLTLVNGVIRNKKSAQSSPVANTLTETAVATFNIPANDAVVGAVYRIMAWGIASVTGTPNFQLRTRIGGVAGVSVGSSGSRVASSGITSHPWRVDTYVTCTTTGVSGAWFANTMVAESVSVAGTVPVTANVYMDGTASNTRDTTISNDLVVTFQWGTASASNTATCQGFAAWRMA